jgi:hypothetical protein
MFDLLTFNFQHKSSLFFFLANSLQELLGCFIHKINHNLTMNKNLKIIYIYLDRPRDLSTVRVVQTLNLSAVLDGVFHALHEILNYNSQWSKKAIQTLVFFFFLNDYKNIIKTSILLNYYII